MTRLLAIAANTFLQTVRQPIYGLIVLATLAGIAIAPSITAWSLDDDDVLLRGLALSTLLMQGLFLAALGSAGVVSVEIEDKTVMTVATKPVSRGMFLFGKFLGVVGAITLAHYVATIATLMAIRHGVLQTNAMHSDMTVIMAGPGIMLVVVIAAALLNYAYDWKFLATSVILGSIGLTLGGAVLLFINPDFTLRTYETTQQTPGIPPEVVPERDFKGIITYRDITETGSTDVQGLLIRHDFDGPISDEESRTLLTASEDLEYQKNIYFLIAGTRKLVGPQVLKAAITLLGALVILTSFAVAISTRLGSAWTLTLTLMMLWGGLVSDSLLRPLANGEAAWSIPAALMYYAVPNIQFFWLIDAISADNVIPFSYMLQCLVYAAVYSGSMIFLGASLFETREVG